MRDLGGKWPGRSYMPALGGTGEARGGDMQLGTLLCTPTFESGAEDRDLAVWLVAPQDAAQNQAPMPLPWWCPHLLP